MITLFPTRPPTFGEALLLLALPLCFRLKPSPTNPQARGLFGFARPPPAFSTLFSFFMIILLIVVRVSLLEKRERASREKTAMRGGSVANRSGPCFSGSPFPLFPNKTQDRRWPRLRPLRVSKIRLRFVILNFGGHTVFSLMITHSARHKTRSV